jgi:hypothetical protein
MNDVLEYKDAIGDARWKVGEKRYGIANGIANHLLIHRCKAA